MGINVTPLGETLSDGEEVLRGLNPKHREDGMPTEGCFILKPHDAEGPSFGILFAAQGVAEVAPLGVRQGITAELFLTKMPSADYGIAQINVGRALQQARARGAIFQQCDDAEWGDHRTAHSMLMGYQCFSSKGRKDLQRHLAKLAAERVLKKAEPKVTS